MTSVELTPREIDVLVHGLDDDVSFDWVLGLLGAEPAEGVTWIRPTAEDLDTAFESLRRLVDGGYALIGRMRFKDADRAGQRPPAPAAPLELIPEDLPDVRRLVDAAVAAASTPTDWAFACWVVNTPKGDAVATAALRQEG